MPAQVSSASRPCGFWQRSFAWPSLQLVFAVLLLTACANPRPAPRAVTTTNKRLCGKTYTTQPSCVQLGRHSGLVRAPLLVCATEHFSENTASEAKVLLSSDLAGKLHGGASGDGGVESGRGGVGVSGCHVASRDWLGLICICVYIHYKSSNARGTSKALRAGLSALHCSAVVIKSALGPSRAGTHLAAGRICGLPELCRSGTPTLPSSS